MDMGIAEKEIKMEKVKWEDLKKACEYLEANPSLYYNYAPLNLLDTVKQGAYKYKTADCWNYIKSLLWSNCAQAYDWTEGSYCYKPNAELGDWTGAQMLAQCYDRSTDMAKIQEGEFLYLTGSGGSHAGIYVGEYGGKRKVCEFTPIWENGCHFSDIADDGTRSYYGVKSYRWQEHGKMPWVEYPKTEVELPIEEPAEDITLVETDGDADENLPLWKKLLIEILFAIAKAIDKVFGEKE